LTGFITTTTEREQWLESVVAELPNDSRRSFTTRQMADAAGSLMGGDS
jgi:hypothetical protein